MNVKLYRRLDALIASKHAGTIEEIATKLEATPRLIKHMISRMKTDHACPIDFCRLRKTHYYTVKGNCSFKFERNKLDLLVENFDLFVKQVLTCVLLLILKIFK
jgi:hypothetical protein